MRRAARTDANHSEVVAALRKIGASVESLASMGGGVPDLLVGYRGRTTLLEVKPGEAKDKRQRQLNDLEADWHQKWRGEVHVVLSPEQAIAVVTLPDRRIVPADALREIR